MAIPDAAHKRDPHKDPKRFSKAPRYTGTYIDHSITKTFRVLSCFSQNKHFHICNSFFSIVCIGQLSSRKWTTINKYRTAIRQHHSFTRPAALLCPNSSS